MLHSVAHPSTSNPSTVASEATVRFFCMMGSAKLNNAPSAQSSIGTRVMVVVDMDVVVDVTEVVVLVAVRVVLLTVAVVEETDVVQL